MRAGFAYPSGVGEMTAAQQALVRSFASGSNHNPVKLNGVTRRRRRKKNSAAASKGPRTRRRARPGRLVKGSAAAKRYMASIRRKRR